MPSAVDREMTASTSAVHSAEVLRSQREAAKEIVQTLARQLPPHDFDDRHCSSLRDDVERATMKEFVEFRIKSALGRGLVCPSTDDVTACHQVDILTLTYLNRLP
jgi:PET Domain